jgi:hypothetical protein
MEMSGQQIALTPRNFGTNCNGCWVSPRVRMDVAEESETSTATVNLPRSLVTTLTEIP